MPGLLPALGAPLPAAAKPNIVFIPAVIVRGGEIEHGGNINCSYDAANCFNFVLAKPPFKDHLRCSSVFHPKATPRVRLKIPRGPARFPPNRPSGEAIVLLRVQPVVPIISSLRSCGFLAVEEFFLPT